MSEGDDAGKALFALSRNEVLRDKARAILPALEAAKTPITREEFVVLMAPQKLVYGMGSQTAAEWDNTLELYYGVLREFSADALRDAFLRWNRGDGQKDPGMGQFFPKPAQLVDLAKKAKAEVFVAAYRARKALERVEAEGPAWTPERKREERQKMIDQGLLTADGKPNFTIGAKSIPNDHPRQSPQQVAQQLRDAATEARGFGQPISRRDMEDPGDVI